MASLNKLEEMVVEDTVKEIDLTNLNVDDVESGVLRDMLKAGYDSTKEEYSLSWSRSSYSRVVKPCRVFWP